MNMAYLREHMVRFFLRQYNSSSRLLCHLSDQDSYDAQDTGSLLLKCVVEYHLAHVW